MKDLIKQVLRESRGVLNIHSKGNFDFKLIDSFTNIYFQKLEFDGMGLYILTRDSRYIMSFNKVNNITELKKYEHSNYRLDGFVLNENNADKIKKAVDNMNEIVELKYNSIKLLNQHLIASISEKITKQI